MTEETYITKIVRQPAARNLKLVWSDDHSAELAYDLLRGYCPCAGCQGHGTDEIQYYEPADLVTPLSIKPVGNYAISIHWSDGHATGIYRFDFLRRLAEQHEAGADPQMGEAQ